MPADRRVQITTTVTMDGVTPVPKPALPILLVVCLDHLNLDVGYPSFSSMNVLGDHPDHHICTVHWLEEEEGLEGQETIATLDVLVDKGIRTVRTISLVTQPMPKG